MPIQPSTSREGLRRTTWRLSAYRALQVQAEITGPWVDVLRRLLDPSFRELLGQLGGRPRRACTSSTAHWTSATSRTTRTRCRASAPICGGRSATTRDGSPFYARLIEEDPNELPRDEKWAVLRGRRGSIRVPDRRGAEPRAGRHDHVDSTGPGRRLARGAAALPGRRERGNSARRSSGAGAWSVVWCSSSSWKTSFSSSCAAGGSKKAPNAEAAAGWAATAGNW
jgi:hypothetical protein